MRAILHLLACVVVLGAAALPAGAETPRELIAHCVGCNLSGMDFRSRDLRGVEFVGANLSGTDFSGADLRNTRFTGADLRRTKFDHANLTGAEFTGVDFESTSFAGATLGDVKFVGVKLDQATADALRAAHGLFSCTGCDLRGLSLRGGDYSGARFVGADMAHADLTGAHFAGAQLVGADLRRATAQSVDFSNARLIGTDLSDANLASANLRDAVICTMSRDDEERDAAGKESCVALGGANLQGADLRGARYCLRDDSECRAVTADELRTIAHADLRGARLQ
jgi:uncharacterized protein YjbI with pentapeptide repeats